MQKIWIAIALLLCFSGCMKDRTVTDRADTSAIAKEETSEAAADAFPAFVQDAVDAGEFSEEYFYELYGEKQSLGFTTYTNPALNLTYCYNEEDPDAGLFRGVHPLDEPGGLMQANAFGEQLCMYIIRGSGEEWVRKQAADGLEQIVQMYREWDDSLRESLGDDYDAFIATSMQERDEAGALCQKRFDPYGREEYEAIQFWPVGYEIAGRLYAGLQINVVTPESGFNSGTTFVFCQIQEDVAIVISIWSELGADEVAGTHFRRFTAVADE